MEFIDLKEQYRRLKPEIDAAVFEVLEGGCFVGGPRVEEFEERLAAYVGRRHCVSCGNGTDALQLAFMACGVGPGDAVFCPAMTFTASAEPAAMLGATPVFCDVAAPSFNLDPEGLERAAAAVEAEGVLRPRAVVAVDFLGAPADMEGLQAVCSRRGMALVEDAAQGMGGMRGGRRLGGFGEVATTSFFPSKPLGCYGDGGALLTDDDRTAALARSLRAHGMGAGGKYDNVRVGLNSRLDALQAAVLGVKLSRLGEEIDARQRVAAAYGEALKGAVACPAIAEGDTSAYAQYVVLAEGAAARDGLRAALTAEGVPTIMYYPTPLNLMGAYAGAVDAGCPVAEDYARRNLGLPFSPYLRPEDQARVIETVLRHAGRG